MNRVFMLISVMMLLSACQSPYQQRTDVVTYRQTQQIIHDKEIVEWRRARGIPLAASIAITANNNIAILEQKARAYTVPRTLDSYINEFAPCYVRREALIAGKHVTLEVPCRHQPANDETGTIFNHRGGSPFPGANFDVSALDDIE